MKEKIQVEEVQNLKTENFRLKLALSELSILNDIATTITSTQPVNQIVDKIVVKCVKHLTVEQGAIMLLDEKDKNNPLHTMIRKHDSSINTLPMKLDAQLTGWMIYNKKPLLVNDFKKDTPFMITGDITSSYHSLLSVPMILKGKMLGLISVFNKRNNELFTEEDKRLLSIIAAQSAQVIENARLYEEEKALISIKEEMRMARDIQQNLLPKENPEIQGFQISGTSIPAREVGGDYFDFIPLGETCTSFCVGDITGKGMPAAMLMANLQATLRAQITVCTDIGKSMVTTNNLLYHSTDSGKFATLFLGAIDVKNSRITYCNAGHDEPLLIGKSGEIIKLSTGGMLLGCFPDQQFTEGTVELESGDLLVLYTDGVTEAMNDKEVEFGLERLIELINSSRSNSSEEIKDLIIRNVRNHAALTPQSDDITLMVIKKL
ncbi:GAF domain-containing SpoIIE family protein phosphatase [Bacteroidota bacterium]